jgi:hypothetical protein
VSECLLDVELFLLAVICDESHIIGSSVGIYIIEQGGLGINLLS